jgi:hypothetical protein
MKEVIEKMTAFLADTGLKTQPLVEIECRIIIYG